MFQSNIGNGEKRVPFYPKINDDTALTLELIDRNIEADPNYLNHEECPYPEKLKKLLQRTPPKLEDFRTNIFEGEDETEVIDVQLQRVISEMDQLGATMATAESNERLNYYKVKTSLLERLIGLRERTFNLKELQTFRSVVISGLEDICTKDQITEFMKRLDGILGVGEDQE